MFSFPLLKMDEMNQDQAGHTEQDSPSSVIQSEWDDDPVMSFLLHIKDHVEMIIVAFIMALVIRCFFVEVFKIPTGSMEPTLMGNHQARAYGGDRIMVNKFHYLFDSVDRFDVVVFRYPLNITRNFIKRAVAVGPEYVKFRRGDIYTADEKEGTFKIARKDLATQQSLWIPLPATRNVPHGGDILDHWQLVSSGDVSGNPNHVRLSAKKDEPAKLRFKKGIVDAPVIPEGGNGRHHTVKDLKITATISNCSSEDRADFTLYDGAWRFQLQLNGDGTSELYIENRAADRDRSFSLPEMSGVFQGGQHTIEFFVYDGYCGVLLDGERLVRKTYRENHGDFSSEEYMGVGKPVVRVREGAVNVNRLGLFRDIYYWWGKPSNSNFGRDTEPVFVPKDRVIVIGDNVNSSRDSRKWKQKVITLKNGQQFYVDLGNWKKRERRSGSPYWWYQKGPKLRMLVDRNGNPLRTDEVNGETIDNEKTRSKAFKFIRTELIVGKALWVWWPYTRIKVIR